MEVITTTLNQACTSIVELWESIQSYLQQLKLGEQFLNEGYTEDSAEDETDDENVACDSCSHYLGGGCCRINLESECREGGGFEAWVSQNTHEPIHEMIADSDINPEPKDKPDLIETILKWASIGICILSYPLVIYKLYEWIKYLFF